MKDKVNLDRLKIRLQRAHDELKPLSRLIGAMFDDIQGVDNVISKYYTSRFDHIEPRKENISYERYPEFEVEGDFYLVRRSRSGHVYIIFGDAHGHFAYAGGLKLFIATSLVRVFDRHEGAGKRSPTAAQIIEALDGEFQRIGQAALKVNRHKPLEDGTNIVVVRVHPGGRKADFGSAGIPVRTITADGNVKQYGGMFDRPKSILFPTSSREKREFKFEAGSISLDRIIFLVFVTDGFENLGRSSPKGAEHPMEKMGQRAIDEALRRPLNQKNPEAVTANNLVESVIRRARDWRKNHVIPEDGDDDRLVLVFDVSRFRDDSSG